MGLALCVRGEREPACAGQRACAQAVAGAQLAAALTHTCAQHVTRAQEGLPYTVFQPLYIYGPHTAKDCEQWFVDRVIR